MNEKVRRFFNWITLWAFVMTPAVAFSQTYSESVVADKPVTYWQFNNDLADTQGNVNLNPAASPEFVAGQGQNNSAYSSSDGKAWAASFGFDGLIGVQDFSYEFWINLKGDNEGKYILQRYAGGNTSEGGGENSLVYESGQIRFIGRSGELAETAAITLPDKTDAWHHLVLSYQYQESTITFYLNGVQAYQNDQAFLEPILGVQDYEIYIGANRVDPENKVLNGCMDELAIYDKALTADQALAHYKAALPDAYSKAVKTDAPLLYWRFEGNFTDEIGQRNLLPSGVQFVDGPGGSPNKALFGRITSLEAQILYDLDSFTYELWFNPKFKSQDSYLIFRNPGSTQNALIFAYKTDGLEFFLLSSGTRPLVTIPNQTDRWYHCAVVNDTSVPELRIYIDGELVLTTPGQAGAGVGKWVVIGGSDQGNPFNGYIDEVAIYNTVLSAERIKAHFNAPIRPASVGEWTVY